MIEISKELLTAIRTDELIVLDTDYDEEDYVMGYLLSNKNWYFKNIYQIANECKKWASLQWYNIDSSVDVSCSYAILSSTKSKEQILDRNKFIKEFEAKTEPEAIFMVCEYILEKAKDVDELQ